MSLDSFDLLDLSIQNWLDFLIFVGIGSVFGNLALLGIFLVISILLWTLIVMIDILISDVILLSVLILQSVDFLYENLVLVLQSISL